MLAKLSRVIFAFSMAVTVDLGAREGYEGGPLDNACNEATVLIPVIVGLTMAFMWAGSRIYRAVVSR